MNTNWIPDLSENREPLYLAIVDALSHDVASGSLTADHRLPTQRELADKLGVALGTVTRAYTEAERRGLVRSEGRRGTFVGEAQSSRAILSSIARSVSQGIDLSKNHPLPEMDPSLATALRRMAHSRDLQLLLEYPPTAGLLAHREAGARWLTRLGLRCEADSVMVTAGAQHAISVILAAETRPGDTIAAEQCTYPGLTAVAEVQNLTVCGLPTDSQGIRPDSFDSLCKRKKIRLLYTNPTLQNPTTTTTPATRRREIAAVAERHGVMVIEDEIMRPLIDGNPGFIASSLPDQTYVVISGSKAISAGLRAGFVLTPAPAKQRLIESISASCLGVPPLMPELLSLWLENGTVDRVIAQRKKESAARHRIAAEILSGFTFHADPAAYHLWLELPEGWTGMKLAMEAQMRGVVVSPAEAFAVDRKAPVPAVRLSLAVVARRELLVSGLTILTEILRGTPGRMRPTV